MAPLDPDTPSESGSGSSNNKIDSFLLTYLTYSGRGKFMPLSLKSKILETPGFLVTYYIKMFPL